MVSSAKYYLTLLEFFFCTNKHDAIKNDHLKGMFGGWGLV
jgi:hypothetical protein